MRKLLTLVLAILSALALMAGPAFAHPHDKAHNGVVGPLQTPQQASGGQAAVAHEGIQCALESGNPHLGSLDPAPECPAN